MMSDIMMLILAWILSYYIRFFTLLDTPLGIPEAFLYFKLIPFMVIIWLLVFTLFDLYGEKSLNLSPFLEGVKIFQTTLIALFTFIAFTYFYEEYRYSRLTLVVFSVLSVVFLITGRSLDRKLLRFRKRHLKPVNVLLISKGKNLEIAKRIALQSKIIPKKIYGVLIEKPDESDLEFCKKHDLRVMSKEKSQNWGDFFNEHDDIKSIVVALPSKEAEFFEKNFEGISVQIPDIQIIPDILSFKRLSSGIDIIDDTPIIKLHESPLSGRGRLIKRAMDIMVSILALAILSPVMIILSILVKRSSKGPILYRQERMGVDGVKFDCLKFRSMPIHVEKETGAVWAKKGENRATKIGQIMRRTSLDELPQFINVLKGEMSLVGPRPERPVFVSGFRSQIPGYMLRHKVKAGITGWAQVNGLRGDTSLQKRIDYDLYYIKNWSFWLDIKIIFMTFREVVFGKNAY